MNDYVTDGSCDNGLISVPMSFYPSASHMHSVMKRI